ncbi:MAG: hypothetical protein ACP5NY_04130 [Thermocladium sp.]
MRLTTMLILDAVVLMFLIAFSYVTYIANLSIGLLYNVIGSPPSPVTSLGRYIYLAPYALAAVMIIATIYTIFTAIRGEE